MQIETSNNLLVTGSSTARPACSYSYTCRHHTETAHRRGQHCRHELPPTTAVTGGTAPATRRRNPTPGPALHNIHSCNAGYCPTNSLSLAAHLHLSLGHRPCKQGPGPHQKGAFHISVGPKTCFTRGLHKWLRYSQVVTGTSSIANARLPAKPAAGPQTTRSCHHRRLSHLCY